MKVLYIIDKGVIGGAAHSFLEMVQRMKEFGVTPIVYTGADNEMNEQLTKLGIMNIPTFHETVLTPLAFVGIKWPYIYFRRWLNYIIARRKALKIILERVELDQIQLIHTNSARNDIGCYISKHTGIPHVMHIREFADLDFDCKTLNPRYISIFNRYTSLFISISDAVKIHWIGKGIRSDKVTTIYNGINYSDITESSDASKSFDVLKMVIIGGVFPTKGQHLAVQAMALLPIEMRKCITLDVIGWYSESYVEQMITFAKENGFDSQIQFLGSHDDVHKLLGKYQIGLMCSRAEGFGRSTAEYMHARLGVIASDSGAGPELIEDGISGLLFKSGDVHELACRIQHFFEDRQHLIKCSNEAQKKARARYTDEINAENIFNVYKSVIQ